jgi:hypothetical protein
VFCPKCRNRPMPIKSVAKPLLRGAPVIRYFCGECSYEAVETLHT